MTTMRPLAPLALLLALSGLACGPRVKTDCHLLGRAIRPGARIHCVANFACLRWQQDGDMLVFTIAADRFLRNMVRAVVGTSLDVGRGKLSLAGFRQVIESKDRSKAGYSVPPHGLYLHAVEYPDGVFLNVDFSQLQIGYSILEYSL